MKKLAVFIIVAAAGVMTSPNVDAQNVPTPSDCVEADNAPPECDQVVGGVYPPSVLPPTTPPPTTVAPTSTVAVAPPTTVPPALPATGSSDSSGILQLAALLITGGALVLVAARRRSPRPVTT